MPPERAAQETMTNQRTTANAIDLAFALLCGAGFFCIVYALMLLAYGGEGLR